LLKQSHFLNGSHEAPVYSADVAKEEHKVTH